MMLNIAICDDRPLQRELLNILIHEYEEENEVCFNIYQFSSGEELLVKFDEDRKFFDLFFLDYYMKRLTGLETALHIRSFSKACPIVFVTAAEKCDFMEAIPFEVLFKPAQKVDLNKILERVLVRKIGKDEGI
ncbi:response regulator [Desulfosporosinus sp.]|uniref:LytR/AlgR family response regulator transcription factor n=1 Tax=Desulfosporosinus sp. TaxID=157907 RepID=UPI0023257767|nr:response regulator [Desulfosporosinus sp.]MCO5388369.1 response regulator [Desulfosporosinus sp.]MDA8223256.1 response regulator [Desulfitobacterium hafniense]